MAATAHPLASQAAIDILKKGGSAVDGWFALHGRFGKLKVGDALDPAIQYARNGFPVTQMIAMNWQRNIALFEANRPMLEEFDNAKRVYTVDGRTPAEGQIFRNPDLAATLEKLAQGGRSVYYEGEIAKTSDAYFRRIGGDLRLADFTSYHGEWVEPRSVNYRGYDVFQLPPNSQGFGVLQMLQLLKTYWPSAPAGVPVPLAPPAGSSHQNLIELLIETARPRPER